MTRLSDKTIITQNLPGTRSLPADFALPEIEATIRDKGYDVIVEKVLLCPCKGKGNPAHLSVCVNCGGSGWLFVNPTRTKLIISGLAADAKLKEAALREWGLVDGGTIKVTAINDNKLTYMDRITVLDATSEHNQILYPVMKDDDSVRFVFTQYDIVSVLFIGLFVNQSTKLTKLEPDTDYTFENNIITLTAAHNGTSAMNLTIRYVHKPVFHVIDILRESMISTKGQYGHQTKLVMPVHAIAKRAHLIKDAENLDGDRLLDNSWLPLC
jgi:hypothetical protein